MDVSWLAMPGLALSTSPVYVSVYVYVCVYVCVCDVVWLRQWGGETSSMFTVASVLSTRIPAVAIAANGGMISRKEVCYRGQRCGGGRLSVRALTCVGVSA